MGTDTNEVVEGEGIVEERLSVGFVLRGPTAEIYEVSKAIKGLLDAHPRIFVAYRRASHGRLWIKEGNDQGDGMQ